MLNVGKSFFLSFLDVCEIFRQLDVTHNVLYLGKVDAGN